MQSPPSHSWKARLIVGIFMLLLAFFGMVATDIRSTGGWDYWKWVVPVYALLALWLSWYERRNIETIRPITLWHELFHWSGLFLAILLISLFVHLGTLSRFAAGLVDLTLLSLTLFLAGIYIEITFVFIGLLLGIFALLAAFMIEYLYVLVIPSIIAAIGLLIIIAWRSNKKNSVYNHSEYDRVVEIKKVRKFPKIDDHKEE